MLHGLDIAGIIPVAVIDDVKNAVPTAKAILNGGMNVMEITFRTPAAAAAISAVTEACGDMLVGAGTVVDLEQCRQAVERGSKFIVSPGFDRGIVEWCVEHDVDVFPGCSTPGEIMAAMSLGLDVLKFFPANVCGGLPAMKALASPFGSVRFIPTGGINAQNLRDYVSEPFIYAVGGSWLCSRDDISAGRFDRITALCAEARKTLLGFEIAHVGINADDDDAARALADTFSTAFRFPVREGSSSVFASDRIEIMKRPARGKRGHLAVQTNRVDIALAELEKNGFQADIETAKYKEGRMTAVYLKEEIGGFAVHLLQK